MVGTRTTLLLVACAALLGCDPNIGKDSPVEGTRSIFDPVAGQIPLPNDALLNPSTGLLDVPLDPSDSDLTAQVKSGLRRLNGWIPASMITIPFDGELDPATLNGDTVRLYDVTGATASPPTFERIDPEKYYVAFNVGRSPATSPPYTLFVRMKPVGLMSPDYEMGHRYMVVVTNGAKDPSGAPAIGSVVMELLKSRTPLVNEFGRSQTILPDADAAQLETLRSLAYAPAFAALEGEVDRAAVVAHAAFSIQTNPMPAFNPMPLGNELPKPIGAPSAANDKFKEPWACFHHPIDPQTAPAGAKMFKRGASLTEVSATVSVGKMVDPDAPEKVLCEQAVILNAGVLEPSATYQVVLTEAILGLDGAPSRQGSLFSLVAATSPLLDTSTDPPTLNSPYIDSTFDALLTTGKDPSQATQEDWDKAYATLVSAMALGTVEDWRSRYAPFIDDLVALGMPRETITATWVFTTADP